MQQLKEIYIVHVDNTVGALGCIQGNPHHFYSICPQGKFIDWVQSLQETYPDFKIRCVQNKGIEEWIRQRMNYPQTQKNNKGR